MSKVFNKSFNFWRKILAYADDIAFLFETWEEAVAVVKELRSCLLDVKIKLGWKKCGIIGVSQAEIEKVNLGLRNVFTDIEIPNC
jgi:hypothetical protein